MASNVIPVRIAHGWAIAWLDLYQTPAVVAESFTSSVKVRRNSSFMNSRVSRASLVSYSEAKMSTRMPVCLNTSASDIGLFLVNPQNQNTNKLGRERRYRDSEKSFPFGAPF